MENGIGVCMSSINAFNIFYKHCVGQTNHIHSYTHPTHLELKSNLVLGLFLLLGLFFRKDGLNLIRKLKVIENFLVQFLFMKLETAGLNLPSHEKYCQVWGNKNLYSSSQYSYRKMKE